MNTLSNTLTTTPLAPLALRVGIVGHRHNRLHQANFSQLSGTILEILETVKSEVMKFQSENKSLYSNSSPILRAISPLAEGSDRIFAEQALNASYDLCCIMPFHQEEYEKDFSPEKSKEEDSSGKFRQILARAEESGRLSCFQLDGHREKSSQAYAMCGKTVLNQSDILIVIWDGEYLGKEGGTEKTLKIALQMGIPIIWIYARADHKWQIIENGEEFHLPGKNSTTEPASANTVSDIKAVVCRVLKFAHENGKEEVKSGAGKKPESQLQLEEFYKKRKPRFTTAIVWKCFRDILGDNKFPSPVFTIRDFEGAIKDEWPEDKSTGVPDIVNKLRPYYAWPDKLAVLYSDRYRSAFIITFFLSAIAVGLALLPIAGGWEIHTTGDYICVWLEIVSIISVLVIVFSGHRKKWHERWIGYRLIAEALRHLRLVSPLGGERPFMQPPAYHKSYGQPESSWMAWYVRAVERFLGVPSVVVDKNHLLNCLKHLSDVIDSQISYHKTNSTRCDRIERRLHNMGLGMLVLTILACSLHILMGVLNSFIPEWLSPDMMTFFCGFFPALGAAMAGINYQGEFRRISKRSEAMCDQLNIIKTQVEVVTNDILNSTGLPDEQFSVRTSEITTRTARLLTNEVLDWRVVFLDKPLNASA